jgi:hypothetical protein
MIVAKLARLEAQEFSQRFAVALQLNHRSVPIAKLITLFRTQSNCHLLH